MNRTGVPVARFSQLEDRVPAYAVVHDVDLVVIRTGLTPE